MSDPTPWLAHYDTGVPATLAPYPNRTVLHYIAELGRTRPGEPALLFKGASLSWSELDRQSDALATALVDLGVERSDRVGLLLPNCPQFVVAQIAAWKVGAIVAPLNPIHTDHELESAITDHNVETIVTLTRFYQRVKQVQRRTPIRRIITSNIKEYFPPLLRLAFTVVRERRDGDHVETDRADYQLKDLLRQYEGTTPGRAAPSPEDAAILLLSGGTTGTPKGALGRHAAYVLTGLQVEAWMKSAFDSGQNVIMVPLPLFHVYANVGIQGLAFVTGNPMALVPNPRDLDDLV